QIIFDTENLGDASCSSDGQLLVRSGIHRTFKGNAAILDNNVNRRNILDGVASQRGVLIDCPVDGATQIIVGRRSRKDFDLVDDDINALDAFDGGLGVFFEGMAEDLAGKRDL